MTPEIDCDIDGVGNGNVDVAESKIAEERKGFEWKRFLEQSLKEWLKRGAGQRAEFAVAFALELRNPSNELVADIELGVDVDLGPREEFLRQNLHVSGERTPATSAHEQPHLFEVDAVKPRAFARDSNDRSFEVELRGGDHELAFANLIHRQNGLAICINAFVENHVAHFHSHIERNALNADSAPVQSDERRLERARSVAHNLRQWRRCRIDDRAVQIDPDLVNQRKNPRAKIHDLTRFLDESMQRVIQRLGEVAAWGGEVFPAQVQHGRENKLKIRTSPLNFALLMAKMAWINRNERKRKTVKKYAALRAELKAKKDYAGLTQLPRDASPTRVVNRCEVTGRRRAFIRRFKVSRLTFRELASQGLIPGVTKSSW
jgi:small subunit ribosomal protein S14